MLDSYSYPRLQGLIGAAIDCLKAIERKANEEARLAKIKADKEAGKQSTERQRSAAREE
jgi:hypothetical protein